jgi:hypothetical protein
MKLFTLASLLLIGMSAPAHSQNPAGRSLLEPTTKLERFENTPGTVIVKSRLVQGSVQGLHGAQVRIEATVLRDATSGAKMYGIAVYVQNPADTQHPNARSYVDYDEIDSLIRGVDYIAKANPSSELSNFEAAYHSRGNLEIKAFTNAGGGAKLIIGSGVIDQSTATFYRQVTAFFDLTSITDIESMFVAAKSKLDSLRAAR